MIKNIILDIGDVLVKTNYNDFLKNKGYDEQTIARIARATYLSPVWKELDRGEWSFGEIVDGFVKNDPEIEETLRHTFDDMKDFILAYPYAAHWVCGLREYETETDVVLRRELRWHVYNLEAMATYSEYYNETKIPQGTIYDYDWGCHASARDNFQHALPLVYYNQTLAKSILRYMLKRTTPFGEIRLIEIGNGYADNERYFTSDQQLYFFLLLSEYLRVTKDYAFLGERLQPYPAKDQAEMTAAELTEKCFIFFYAIQQAQANTDW